MKTLMLLNPRRRSRSRVHRARRVRRVHRIRRRRSARALAVKSARPVRRVRRSHRHPGLFRKRFSAGDSMILRTNPRRRQFGRSSGSSGSLGGLFRSFASKDMLMLAGGAIGATALTTIVLTRAGDKLPGAGTTAGTVLYTVGIPFLGAFIVRRWSPALANGLLIGAMAQGITALAGGPINTLVARAAGAGTAAGTTSEYLGRKVGEYIRTGKQLGVSGASYDAIKTFGAIPAVHPYGSASAFRNSAWQTPY